MSKHKEMFNMTELRARPHWTQSLIKQLLGEPDLIERRNDNTVLRRLYDQERVLEAEMSAVFRQRKEDNIKARVRLEDRAAEIRAGLLKAIELDIQSLKIPKKGDFDEVYAYCLKNLRAFNDMNRIVDMDAYREVYSPFSLNGMINPKMQLCELIAEARVDLAFTAGRHYQMAAMNIGYYKID